MLYSHKAPGSNPGGNIVFCLLLFSFQFISCFISVIYYNPNRLEGTWRIVGAFCFIVTDTEVQFGCRCCRPEDFFQRIKSSLISTTILCQVSGCCWLCEVTRVSPASLQAGSMMLPTYHEWCGLWKVWPVWKMCVHSMIASH